MAESRQDSWWQQALAVKPAIDSVNVDGSRIEYQHWGDRTKPALIFIHGAAAHANWWDFIAPFFTEHYFVIAPHLSGMGNSDHRDAYSSPIFARDVMGVYEQLNLDNRTLVVGHSLGGAVALTLAAEQGQRLRAAVMIDSAVFPPGADLPFDPTKAPYRPKTICDDYETAAERFFLLPPQPCEQPHLLEHVGGGVQTVSPSGMEEVRQFHNRGTKQEDVNRRHQTEYGREQQFECRLVCFFVRSLPKCFPHVIAVICECRRRAAPHAFGLNQQIRKRMDVRHIDSFGEVFECVLQSSNL